MFKFVLALIGLFLSTIVVLDLIHKGLGSTRSLRDVYPSALSSPEAGESTNR